MRVGVFGGTPHPSHIEAAGNELDGLWRQKSDEAAFAKIVSEAEAIKELTHRIMHFTSSGK